MKKSLFAALVMLVAAFTSSCELLEKYINPTPPGNNNAPKKFSAFLSGFQEVPAVKASGAGHSVFTLSKDSASISYQLWVANTDKILFAHIHLAAPGKNGDIVADLLTRQNPATGLVNGLLKEGVIKKEDLKGPLAGKPLSDLIKALETGNAYTNIHTEDFPAGELRGQIGKEKAAPSLNFASKLTGDQEVPPVTTPATGQATYQFNKELTELTFKVSLANIKDVRFAHIHLAPVGVNGDIVVTLKQEKVVGPVNGAYAEGKITAKDLSGNLKGGSLSILKAAMESAQTYTNVHSDAYPAGEVRGQIQ